MRCRSPHGQRGLKSFPAHSLQSDWSSQPSWAAWIEIYTTFTAAAIVPSQPSWAAWIEMASCFTASNSVVLSQPSWAAWIEMASTAAF